jgi:PAN domain
MSLSKYNNQTLLTIKDVNPLNDDRAKERGNSLRLLGRSLDVNKWFECRDACLNNPDCVVYKFDHEKPMCEIYRKEPYKEVKNLSLDQCKEFCSKDDNCDFLSHHVNNTCKLHTREEDKSEDKSSRTSIGDLWLDYPVYGLNVKKGVKANSFDECRKKLGTDHFVYYADAGYCVPRRFFEQNVGNTTIFFNKEPVDKYESLDNIIDKITGDPEEKLKSKNREQIHGLRRWFIGIWLIILILIIYWVVINMEDWKQ